MKEFKAGRVSLYAAMVSMAVAAVPSHGYTMIAFFVFLVECAAIMYIRSVSKTTEDQHHAWIAGGAVLIVEVQQEWPPNAFMFWHTVILAVVLIATHFIAKAEVPHGDVVKV